jgi:hypothetical protein
MKKHGKRMTPSQSLFEESDTKVPLDIDPANISLVRAHSSHRPDRREKFEGAEVDLDTELPK